LEAWAETNTKVKEENDKKQLTSIEEVSVFTLGVVLSEPGGRGDEADGVGGADVAF